MKRKLKSLGLVVAITLAVSRGHSQDAFTDPDSVPESAALLSAYIRYSSVTGNEKPAGEFLAALCQRKGLQVEIFSSETDSYNFAASLYPLSDAKPNIVFLNHIDVVPPGDSSRWTFPPFSGAISEGQVWGRGAIDLKGLAIMQLMAISYLKSHSSVTEFPYNVTMLCVSQEEQSGSLGAQRVVNNHFERLNAVVVFGEGGAGLTGLIESSPSKPVFCISTAEKQAVWVKLIVRIPTSGHGSVPPAEYANKIMVRGLTRLLKKHQKISISPANEEMFSSMGAMETGIKGLALRNIRLFKPVVSPVLRKDPKVLAVVSNTITLTNLANPPGAVNQIAQEVTASLDCRLLPGTNQDEFLAELKKAFRKSPIDLDIMLETVDAQPSPVRTEFYQNFKQAIKEIYPDAEVMPYLFPAYTDNNYFRNKGVPVYGIKPVHLSQELLMSIHNVDERLPISSLEQGIEVYKAFLIKSLSKEQPLSSLKNLNR